jgi:hypothetical protein
LASRGLEKLASVPCFVVTDRDGNFLLAKCPTLSPPPPLLPIPYIVNPDTGYDVAVIFLDHRDAEEMALGMMQSARKMMEVGQESSLI